MNALAEIGQAALGWRDLLLRRNSWQGRFALSSHGLGVALLFYFTVVGISILMQVLSVAQPSIEQVIANVGINLLPLMGVLVAILLTALMLRLRALIFTLLVPAVHALALLLVVGLPLSFVEAPLGPLLLGALGYMMYRLGRAAAALKLPLAIAFALLCVVLLVALPLSLYMVIAPGPGPI